jgi:hypothetical protein
MGAGGIIQQRAAVLVTTAKHHCFYDTLSDSDKAAVDAVHDKAPQDRTQADCKVILEILSALC